MSCGHNSRFGHASSERSPRNHRRSRQELTGRKQCGRATYIDFIKLVFGTALFTLNLERKLTVYRSSRIAVSSGSTSYGTERRNDD
jgi:hypothetical protein